MGIILPNDDVLGVAERVRLGDPFVGWRGDPTMDVILDEATGTVNVLGFDAQGHRYVAASVSPRLDPGWRHALLVKLRDGDWQIDDLVARTMAKLDAPHVARDKALSESMDEKAERVAWAIRRDAGHLVGQSKEFY